MFVKKRDFLELANRVEKIQAEVDSLLSRQEDILTSFLKYKDSFATCAKCGCVIKKKEAYKAPGTVRTKKEPVGPEGLGGRCVCREYIHHDYYCKEHSPN